MTLDNVGGGRWHLTRVALCAMIVLTLVSCGYVRKLPWSEAATFAAELKVDAGAVAHGAARAAEAAVPQRARTVVRQLAKDHGIAQDVLIDAGCEVAMTALKTGKLPTDNELIASVAAKQFFGSRLTPQAARKIVAEFEEAKARDNELYFGFVWLWCNLPSDAST